MKASQLQGPMTRKSEETDALGRRIAVSLRVIYVPPGKRSMESKHFGAEYAYCSHSRSVEQVLGKSVKNDPILPRDPDSALDSRQTGLIRSSEGTRTAQGGVGAGIHASS